MANHIHDLMEIFVMSLALGMDAFSLALGLGLQGLKRDTAVQLMLSIGIYHVMFTVFGLLAGMVLQGLMGNVAKWFAALVLIGLGVHMVYATLFKSHADPLVGSSLTAVTVFAASVSLDALSVGFSLGLRTTGFGVTAAVSFGVWGAAMCGLGLLIGKRASRWIGLYGQLLGAAILIGFGLRTFIH
ncbi:manganese efflux pump MntP [Alicyclobacillus kakegawensis]|uniref:manganese efflux pump MntP n=1 Tax=Alicyclobacillus kakegawensis TaxID=392012 RepID=UPI000ABF38B5|nr:manganese efflux pump [Alicyclobacillus kakegawensis]